MMMGRRKKTSMTSKARQLVSKHSPLLRIKAVSLSSIPDINPYVGSKA
jgi:hypothetical protein